MKAYILSLAAGLLVGVICGALNVRLPAPPVVAADVRFRDVLRGFVQVGVLEPSGRDGGSGPNDIDHLNVMQAFLDLSGGVSGGRATLCGGRQEMSFGCSRLVSVRESPNARRTFDGGRGFWRAAGYRIDTFYVRPVIIEPGTFDNPTNGDEQLFNSFSERARS